MKWIWIIAAGIALSSCTKQNETPAEQDSLLVKPLAEHMDTVSSIADSTGLVVDSLRLQQDHDRAAIARFTPKQVHEIYEAYWPLRSGQITPEQLNAFLAKYKISEQELHSVLVEGDRLGWAQAHKG
jgi:hypothetical protein